MTEEEIKRFMTIIKKDYPNSKLTSEELEEWKDALNKISFTEASIKYYDHRNNANFRDKFPSIRLFIKTSSNINYITNCIWCGKQFSSDEIRLHEERHSSVNYIVKQYKEHWDIEIDKSKYDELMNMDQEEFDAKYDDFLEKLNNKCPSKIIQKILYLNANPGKELPIEFYEEDKKDEKTKKVFYGITNNI